MTTHRVFIGRDEEVKIVAQVLLETPPGSVLLVGRPGMGKTALARAVFSSEQLAERFGSRRYWVSMGHVQSRFGMLSAIARAMGNEETREPEVLDHLRRAPALLVMDDVCLGGGDAAIDVDEVVTDLLRLGGIGFVATAKTAAQAFSLRWTRILALEPLAASQTREVFLSMAGDSVDHNLVDDAIAATGNVPGVAELLGRATALAGALPTTLAPAADDASRMQHIVDTAVERVTAMAGSETVRRLLAIVAALPNGLSVDDVGKVTGLASTDTNALLELGLVVRDGNRLRVIAPLVERVRRAVSISDIDRQRCADYFLKVAHEGASIGSAGGHQSLARVGNEAENIQWALRWALEHNDADAPRAALAFGNFMRYTGAGDPQILDAAREAARRQRDAELEARLTSRLADATLNRFDHVRAQQLYNDAAVLFRSVGEARGEAASERSLGVIALRQSRWHQAEEHFRRARAVSDAAGDALGAASAVERLGDVLVGLGRIPEATAHLLDALKRYESLANVRGQANCHLSLAEIALDDDRIEDAEASLALALEMHQSTGDQLGIANSLFWKAEIKRRREDPGAVQAFAEALALYQRVGNKKGEANCVYYLARAALKKRTELQDAEDRFRSAAVLYRRIGDTGGEANTIVGIADVTAAKERIVEAASYYREALALYQQNGDWRSIGESHVRLAAVSDGNERQSHIDAAVDAWQRVRRDDLVAELRAAPDIAAMRHEHWP